MFVMHSNAEVTVPLGRIWCDILLITQNGQNELEGLEPRAANESQLLP